MNSETALYWMIGFCAVATAALVIQVILLAVLASAAVKTRKQIAGLIEKTEPLIWKLEPIVETTRRLADELRQYAGEFSGKANEILELSRKQLVTIDGVLGEAAARTRSQMDRIEMVMDDTVNRFQETTSLLQNGVVRPLRQLNALSAGIRATLSALLSGRRATVEQATHDEEMFI